MPARRQIDEDMSPRDRVADARVIPGNGFQNMINKWLLLVVLAAFSVLMYFAVIWKMS